MPSFQLEKNIEHALSSRSIYFDKPVLRLFDGLADGHAGLIIDRYNTLIVAHYFPASRDEDLGSGEHNQIKDALCSLETTFKKLIPTLKSLILKVHPHDPKEHKKRLPETLWGEEPAESFELIEGEYKYEIRPSGSLFCGVYPDTAFIREAILEISPKKVINAFCFTGALGTVSAREGMTQEILQVDSSPAALKWAGANWDLNKSRFPGTEMRFLCDECMNFFGREIRRIEKGAERSDLIILDPPSFGRGRNKVFSIKNDAKELLSLAMECLSDRGTLFFTCNYKTWPAEKISALVSEVASNLGRKILDSKLLVPPKEIFPTQPPDSISVRGVRVVVGR